MLKFLINEIKREPEIYLLALAMFFSGIAFGVAI